MALDYAPPGRLPQWRRHRRAIVAITIAIITGLLGWRFGPRYWQTIHTYYLQNRALSYTAPDNDCIMRFESKKADMVVSEGFHSYKDSWAVPPAWGDYVAAANVSFGPTLFLGYRTSSAGNHRLIAVESLLGFGTDMKPPKERSHAFAVVASVIAPGTLTALPTVFKPAHVGLCGAVEPEPVLQLFAGHPDLADPSHFTIIYQVGSQRGNIDGYLQNDDTVKMQIRDGPATGGLTDPF